MAPHTAIQWEQGYFVVWTESAGHVVCSISYQIAHHVI